MVEVKPSRPHVVIAGGSGFLGQGLSKYLIEHGYRTMVLTRMAGDSRREHEVWVQWDAKLLGTWAACLDGAAAVVNVVGRSVDCRKTDENKRVILASRIDSCRVLGEAMREVAEPPPVWVQSSTAHIVGDPIPLETICDESTPPGEGMAPEVGVAWEAALDEAILPEQRGVKLRISFVLGKDGGAMARLGTLANWGLGGTVGSGRQWMSWIHQHDLNRLILAMIKDDTYRGVYMVTAPDPQPNRMFMKLLRRACGRPWSPPAPAIGVRIASRFILNTDPELALLGRRCLPTRLVEEHRFAFEFPELGPALVDVV